VKFSLFQYFFIICQICIYSKCFKNGFLLKFLANNDFVCTVSDRVLARISKVAVQNNFGGVATNCCGRGHMFLGVAAIICRCGIVVFYSLNLFTFSFRCTFPSLN
jgi:hypothetical protein